MKIYKWAGMLLLTIVLSTSCRVHDGLTRNENQHQTQVVLSEKNYRIVRYVEGDASGRYYFGIGGGKSQRGVVARARENMLANAGLIGKSRAVINETVETQYKQLFFMTEVRYIVSAYVVEFYDPATDPAPVAEESRYVEPEKPATPNVVTRGVTAGITLQPDENSNVYQDTHKPGFHLGYMLEFSNPDIKYLFWSTQLNFSYLNTKTTYNNQPWSSEKSYCLEIPVLIGVKVPIGRNFQWFAKGGPTLGIILNNYQPQGSDSWENDYLGDSAPSVGGELYSGFQLGRNFQLSAGHRWNIGYYNYDYTKISLSYLF